MVLCSLVATTSTQELLQLFCSILQGSMAETLAQTGFCVSFLLERIFNIRHSTVRFLPDGALLYLCSSGDENMAAKGKKQRAA